MSKYPKLCLKPYGMGMMGVGIVEKCQCILPMHHDGWCMIRPRMVLCTEEWPNGASGILLQISAATLETLPATYEQYSQRFRSAIQ